MAWLTQLRRFGVLEAPHPANEAHYFLLTNQTVHFKYICKVAYLARIIGEHTYSRESTVGLSDLRTSMLGENLPLVWKLLEQHSSHRGAKNVLKIKAAIISPSMSQKFYVSSIIYANRETSM